MPSLETPLWSTHVLASPGRARTFDAILWGGMTVGVLDGLYAMSLWGLRGVAPDRVWQGVASGLLGAAAFQGGLPTAALGLALHFFIATVVAAVYVVASLKLPVLVRRAVGWGMAYGVAVYLVMRYAVIPLSAARSGSFSWTQLLSGLVAHVFLVGLPSALWARRAARPSRE